VSLSLSLYRAVTGLLEPLAPLLLDRRAKRGKEDFGRLNERLGRPAIARPPGPLVWLHGVSVGESLSLLPLVDGLRAARKDATVLVTSGTVTSAELLAKRLPGNVIHQFAPVDAPGAVGRFLNHWRPDVGVLVERELWPNLILAAHERGARMVLASARITAHTARNWARTPGGARELLGAFDVILPQDDESEGRIAGLGRPGDGRLNLKYAGEPLPFDAPALTALKRAAGERPVLLAASTHEGEDALVLEAFQALDADRRGDPMLVIVPRHRERGEAVAELSRLMGFETGRFGEDDAFGGGCDVYVADSLGDLGLWFRLSHSAFLGGSLLPGIGGHNPLEAVQVGAPAISGPHVANWAGVYRDLETEGLVRMLAAPGDLTAAWEVALDLAEPRKAIEKRAAAIQQHRRRELDDAIARIAAMLPTGPA
jgi:3-deoxy-D-manno-octulosonic-acid transferase